MPVPGAEALERLWAWHGLEPQCLRRLDACPPSARAAAACELLATSALGLSGAAMDRLLGFDIERVHQAVSRRLGDEADPAGAWRFHGPTAGALPQTRYRDLVWLVDQQARGAHLVDIGSGLGRLGLVAGLRRPDLRFVGLELVEERVDEAQRVSRALGLSERIVHRQADAARCRLPEADTYYLFFPFPAETARRVFGSLEAVARRRAIQIVLQGVWPDLDLRELAWLRTAPAPVPFCRYQSVPR